MNEPVILALDVGSSSRRGQLVDRKLRFLVDKTPRRHNVIDCKSDGSATIDANELTEDVISLLDQLTNVASELPVRVVGVAISCIWHSVVGAEPSGQATTPILTWADQRPASIIEELRRALDHRKAHLRTGCPVRAQYFPAKLAWIKRSEPTWLSSTTRWASPADHVLDRLVNDTTTSSSMASGTGLMNQASGGWDSELLSILGVSQDVLAPIRDDAEAHLKTEYNDRWPQLVNAFWLSATGDGAAATIGAAASNPGDLTISVGTTSAVRLVHPSSVGPPPLEAWRYLLSPGRPISGGCLTDGGSTLDRLRRDLDVPDDVEQQITFDAISANSDSLLTGGERGPWWSEDGGANVLDPDDFPDPVVAWQSAIQGVSGRLAEIAAVLEQVHPIERVICTGGAYDRSHLWHTAIADALGRPIVSAPFDETSLRGVASLAWDRVDVMNREGSLSRLGECR